ncbi:hypothetical protein HOU41_gp127 [Proteus phage Stubb]|uniref:Uncharacterized protein n=1 Tax=Proteus phage Stubb TaxID=2315597 RepID=A0A3B8DX64_9CAUD|nr:hypothetical protein HOU41_gp127 [Proteus phage Stubb]AYJ73217.1 hypothetical protein CPT_Stubb_100 [Proteus phage Stubb]
MLNAQIYNIISIIKFKGRINKKSTFGDSKSHCEVTGVYKSTAGEPNSNRTNQFHTSYGSL